MDLFGKDMIIGDFRLSDFGFMLGSFELTNGEEELGMDYNTIEQYIGHNPVPIYLGAKYSNKLKPQATIIKNPKVNKTNPYFSEHECREVLRKLTGFDSYRTMQIYLDEFDEFYQFNVRITSVNYRKIGAYIGAIILHLECDSPFAWSNEFRYSYNLTPEKPLVFVNTSDDLNNYLLPKFIISPHSSTSNLSIVNITDNNYTTSIKNISENEIITMDSKNKILQSSIQSRIILNDFNLHFIRFISGRNELSVNIDCNIYFSFQLPRKVGFL